MDISELALKLIIILIPGALASLIIEALTIHKKWSPFRWVLNSIFSGGLAYLILQFISKISDRIKGISLLRELKVWNSILVKDSIPFDEILWAGLIAIVIGFIVSAIIFHKVIFRIGRSLKVSYKFGDDSLFYSFLNSKEVGPIYIRDIENNKTYHGYLLSFSEDDFVREISLSDVDVYEYSTSKLIYNTPHLYLSKNRNVEFVIELPNFKNQNGETKTIKTAAD